MKILVSQLATDKNPKRLELISAGTIRSKSGSHTVIRQVIAEGVRPSLLGPEFNWIQSEHIRLNDRHIFGLECAIKYDDVDLVVFCDDDVVIDLDLIADMALTHQDSATIWCTDPGMGCSAELESAIHKHASKFMVGKNCKNMFMGFCTSVVNRKFLDKVRSNIDALEATWKISRDVFHSGFVVDVQISILGFIIGSKQISGIENGGTCWASFCASSLLSKTGKMWHVHGFRESEQIKQESLLDILHQCPQDNEKILGMLFSEMSYGFKAKNWVDKPLRLHWMFRPWTGRIAKHYIMRDALKTQLVTSSDLTNSGTITWEHGRVLKWEACEGGLRVHDDRGWSIKFVWKSHENAIFGYLENPTGLLHDTTVYGLWSES